MSRSLRVKSRSGCRLVGSRKAPASRPRIALQTNKVLTLAPAELRGRRPARDDWRIPATDLATSQTPRPEERARAMSYEDPHPMDSRGQNLRFFRTQAGLSQTALADGLGLSFQQIQKYEKGANRLAASRLYDCAQILKISLAQFYCSPGAPLETLPVTEIDRHLVEWITLYQRLAAPARKQVIRMAQLLASPPHE
jgi:transcriptional regulator with XRE-family HTH domain